MVTDLQEVLRLWRKHFSTLLQGDNDTNTAFRDVVPNLIDDGGVEIASPSHEEVKVAIMRLKNKTATGPGASPLNCLRPDVMGW